MQRARLSPGLSPVYGASRQRLAVTRGRGVTAAATAEAADVIWLRSRETRNGAAARVPAPCAAEPANSELVTRDLQLSRVRTARV